MTLEQFFAENREVAIAFSGGVDSAYLLYAATRYAARVKAYYVSTAFQPEFELEDARRLAADVGADMQVLHVDVLSNSAVTANPPDRCYHCKRALFTLLAERAASDGYSELIDGTNASDDPGDRPGTRALRELRVLSPLRECGITKADVRRLSREAGLFTYAKPSYACLATRVPTGRRIEAGALGRIEAAESALRALGYDDLRVRLCEGGVRLELPESELERAVRGRGEILRALDGMGRVTLDLRGR